MLTRYYWTEDGMEKQEDLGSRRPVYYNVGDVNINEDTIYRLTQKVLALEARLAEIEAQRCETCALYHPVNEDYGLCVRNQSVMVFPDHGCRAWVAKEERDG